MIKNLTAAILSCFILFQALPVKSDSQTVVIRDEAFTHVINRNETLSEIAQIFGVSVETLLRYNPWITNRHMIPAGGGLRIPVRKAYSSETEFIVLPPGIIQVSPETVREAINEAAPEIAKLFPKEMNLSRSSLNDIGDTVRQAVPDEMEIGSSSMEKIREEMASAVSGAIPGKVEISESSLAELRKELAAASSPRAESSIISGIPNWVLALLIFIAIIGMIGLFAFLYPRSKSTVDREEKWEEKKEKNEERHIRKEEVPIEKATPKKEVPEKKVKTNNIVLMPSAGKKDFHEWLDQNKQIDPEKTAKCFRCGENIKIKNMSRHLYERCGQKPNWAVQEKRNKREIKIENGKDYRLKP
jgi:LysM repeat protein